MSETRDLRVLLVDDEEELIEYMSKRLLREGFMVRCAGSGADAVAVADAQDFDVAVVDIKMPGMDGVETQRLLRERRPYLKCIVLTGHGSIETALESGRQDAFRYFQKPVDHAELVNAIRQAGEMKREEQQREFLAQVQEIASSYSTPGSIHKAVEELRHKLGMD
jgi:two-component system NtrC family response regulator